MSNFQKNSVPKHLNGPSFKNVKCYPEYRVRRPNVFFLENGHPRPTPSYDIKIRLLYRGHSSVT